jgi:hypothetical protein
MKRIITSIIFSLIALASFAQSGVYVNASQIRFVNRAKLTAADTAATFANDGRMWYDETTKQIRFIRNATKYSLGASGTSSTALSGELPKSNGTTLVSSGLFVPSSGNITLGSASIAGDRTILVSSSTASPTLFLTGQGPASYFQSAFGGYQFQLTDNPGGTALADIDITYDVPTTTTTFGIDTEAKIIGGSGGFGYGLTIATGDAVIPDGSSGNMFLDIGAKDGAGSYGNMALFTTSSSSAFGGGQKVLHIHNAVTAPSSNPSNGALLYAEGGELKARSSTGTTTTLGSPDFTTLTYGATVTWATSNYNNPKAKVTATGNFTLDMTNVKSGSFGILKVTTNTAGAITITFDTDFTNTSLNVPFTTFTLPAATAKDYFLSYVAVGTVLEWSIVTAPAINDPSGSDDDILQRKSGAWTNRTLTQVRTDLASMFTMTIGHAIDAALVLTNMANAEQCVPNNNSIHIFYFDATYFRQARIDCRVATLSASANNPRLYLQYSTNGGAAWNTVGGGTIASGDVISLTATGFIKSNWIDIPGGGKGDYLWRVAQNGGDAVADPAVGNIHVTFRM